MLVIGLTGGIGSGKSTAAKLFAARGIAIVDTDHIAREVTAPGQPALDQIVKKFGEDILLPDHKLDRAKLRKIIFEDEEKRQWLEQLLHPLIRIKMYDQIQSSTSPYCITVIPLLLETKPDPIINRILVVDSKEEEQIERAQARDKLSRDEILAIIKTQVSRDKRLNAADDIIFNNAGLVELNEQVEKLHQFYLSLGR